METSSEFECFCGDRFPTREALIGHNVDEHDMSYTESRDKVMKKYPS